MDVACNRTTRNEDRHMKTHKYVGLDVHSLATVIAVADGRRRSRDRVQSAKKAEPLSMSRCLALLAVGFSLADSLEPALMQETANRWIGSAAYIATIDR
jgi:hypothetical protein